MPDSAYRHSVELHRMVRNGYSVSIRWVVKTVQGSLPMCVFIMYLSISVLFIISVSLYISLYPQEDPYPFLFRSPARYVLI